MFLKMINITLTNNVRKDLPHVVFTCTVLEGAHLDIFGMYRYKQSSQIKL